MANLKDNRTLQAMTVSEADDLFLEIARLKAFVDKETAAHKKKLADLEIAHKEKIAAALFRKEELEERLAEYIAANPDRFIKPRKHPVGQIGTYGVVTDPAYILIQDKAAVIAFALADQPGLIRTEHTPNKEAIMEFLLHGGKVPGAKLIPAGDVAKLTFKKGYAENLEGTK